MIEFNKIYMITVKNEKEDELVIKTFKNPYWLGEAGMKKFPKSYFIDLTTENDVLVKTLVQKKKGEIK